MSEKEGHIINSIFTDKKQNGDDPVALVNELAEDARTHLLSRMEHTLRYPGQYPEIHVFADVLVRGRPCLIVFSGTVLPVSAADSYGKTFADDLKKGIAKL